MKLKSIRTDTRLCHFVGVVNDCHIGISGYLPLDQANEIANTEGIPVTNTQEILKNLEHYEFPKFNGTRILFNFNWLGEVDGYRLNNGCYCAFDVLEYQKWYKPDCSDCINGLKNIREHLRDVSTKTHTGLPQYALDKVINEMQHDIMMASIKTFVVRFATGAILTYRI